MFAVPCRIDRRRSKSCKGVSPANSQRAFLWVFIMVARRKTKLVHGVGVNDSDYPVTRYEREGGSIKRCWTCPFYRKWESMLNRCYSHKYLVNKPTYAGCSVTQDWHSFLNFRAWMITKNWHGMVLDKDILLPGNKVYSQDFCIFITQELNSFTTDSGAVRGDHPIGVFFNERHGKFESHCNNPFTGRYELLGKFDSAIDAHNSWLERKHEHACRYADMQNDERISIALRSRYANGFKEVR